MFAVLPAVQSFSPPAATSTAPPAKDKAAYARWMMGTFTWGFLSTTSTRSDGTAVGKPFGNPYGVADVDGVPCFYGSSLDASFTDIFGKGGSPLATLALSEASVQLANGSASAPACQIGNAAALGDPENPPCARLVLTGTMVNKTGDAAAEAALFKRHPYFAKLPKDHDFFAATLNVTGVWLIDFYGGAAIIDPADYFAAKTPPAALGAPAPRAPPAAAAAAAAAAVATGGPPHFSEKAAVARYWVRNLQWGVLSTTSTRSDGTTVGAAFGNPYSFADVDGVPYFYASDLDASMIDAFGGKGEAYASLALSEAALFGPKSFWWKQNCQIGEPLGDPENPPCARVVLSGALSKPAAGSAEETAAKAALFARHPSFADYPPGHDFFVAKMELSGIWEIDMFGGAAIIAPTDYFKAKP